MNGYKKEMVQLFFEQLREELTKDLPGEEFQNRMASPYRFDYNSDSGNPQKGSVLILLYPYEKQIKTVLIKRAFDNFVHSGQISLPGGKFENSDVSPFHTALREAKEEIDVKPDDIHILGSLTSLYIPASSFLVLPVIGYLEYKPDFHPNPDEVQEIIEVSLQELFDPENRSIKIITKNNIIFNAPCYNAGNHQVWGATAMILSEFFEIVNRTGFFCS